MTEEETLVAALSDPDLSKQAGALGTIMGLQLAARLAQLPEGVEPGSLAHSTWIFETMGLCWSEMRSTESRWREAGHPEAETGSARFIGALVIVTQLQIANITASASGPAN